MKIKIIFCLIFLLAFPFILAACGEGQIDINSASVIELDKLTGVGEVKAQAIIDSRPYSSVDNLVNAYGIGPATLEKIKTQGLACVADESEKKEEEVIEEEVEDSEEDEVEEIEEIQQEDIINNEPVKTENKVIDLSPQTIKSEDYTFELSNSDLAKYSLVGFCILLGGLFGINKLKSRKNEFR